MIAFGNKEHIKEYTSSQTLMSCFITPYYKLIQIYV